MNSTSEREPSSGENSTSSVYSRACATAARTWPLTSSRVVCSLRSMWMSLVAMNVWMRGRSESRTAFQAASMSCLAVRASPQITGPSTSRAIACTDSKSPGEVIGKPASITSTPEPRELVGDLQLFLLVQRDPRRLLAVAQRRVEDQDAVALARVCGVLVVPLMPSSCSLLSSRLSSSSLLGLRLRGRHALFPPRGEQRSERARPENDICGAA